MYIISIICVQKNIRNKKCVICVNCGINEELHFSTNIYVLTTPDKKKHRDTLHIGVLWVYYCGRKILKW